jgi:hypothetical protein
VRAILPGHHDVGALFEAVYESLGRHAARTLGPHPGEAGQTLVLWYDTEHREHDIDGAAAFFVRCRAPLGQHGSVARGAVQDSIRTLGLVRGRPGFAWSSIYIPDQQSC